MVVLKTGMCLLELLLMILEGNLRGIYISPFPIVPSNDAGAYCAQLHSLYPIEAGLAFYVSLLSKSWKT